MEFGSVRFFKRLILTVIAFILVIPTIISIVFAVNNHKYKALNKEYEDKIHILSAQVHKKITEEKREETEKEKAAKPDNLSEVSFAYQKLYPNLYCEPAVQTSAPKKTAFLTFDDGPSENTPVILKTLKEKKIKATFFVMYSSLPEAKAYLKQIAADGHTIGIHTYSHDYRKIYTSVEAYLSDFNKMYNFLYETTGQKATIFRFPGGSINTYNQQIYKEIIAEMVRRGFTYYDWNLSANDAVSDIDEQKVIDNVLKDSPTVNTGIVLMHDSRLKNCTAQALPAIIDGLREQGFSFAPLTNKVKPIIFGYSE